MADKEEMESEQIRKERECERGRDWIVWLVLAHRKCFIIY